MYVNLSVPASMSLYVCMDLSLYLFFYLCIYFKEDQLMLWNYWGQQKHYLLKILLVSFLSTFILIIYLPFLCYLIKKTDFDPTLQDYFLHLWLPVFLLWYLRNYVYIIFPLPSSFSRIFGGFHYTVFLFYWWD
jgi:hypothetical protein